MITNDIKISQKTKKTKANLLYTKIWKNKTALKINTK